MIYIAAKEGLATFTSNAIIVMPTCTEYIHNISINISTKSLNDTILEKIILMNYAVLYSVYVTIKITAVNGPPL